MSEHPPAPDQQKNEPFGASPETSAQAGEASGGDALTAVEQPASVGPPVDGGVPSPGDSQGVSVPSVQAATGTSEESGKVDAISVTALAPPGKPDGEVDTRA